MAVAFSAGLAAQNLSITAVADGAMDLTPRLQRIDQLYLVVPLPETALTVLELGDAGGWWWSYIVPPLALWRDGCVERVSLHAPASFRVPVSALPLGVWRLRVGTAYGYSDTIELRFW